MRLQYPNLPDPTTRIGRMARRVYGLRVALKLDVKDLAARAGVSVSTIRRCESGKFVPRRGSLLRLARALQTSAEYLSAETDIEPAAVTLPAVEDGPRAADVEEFVPLPHAARAAKTTSSALHVLLRAGRVASRPDPRPGHPPLVDLRAVLEVFPPDPGIGVSPFAAPVNPVPTPEALFGSSFSGVAKSVHKAQVQMRQLEARNVRAAGAISKALGVPPATPLAYRRFVEEVNGAAVRICSYWAPSDAGGFGALAQHGLPPMPDDAQAFERLFVHRANLEEAILLSVNPDSPVAYIERHVFAPNGHVAYVAVIVHRGDAFVHFTTYRMHSGPTQAWPWGPSDPPLHIPSFGV